MSESVSVIIPALNEARQIEAAVESAWRSGATEVIVADGGSEDETLAILEELDCKVVRCERGRGPQQNAGAAAASGDILLFLHADNRLPENLATEVLERFAHPQTVFAIMRQRIDAKGLRFRCLELGNRFRATWLRLPYGDQCFIIRAQTFNDLGGFPSVPLMEDVVLARKLSKQHRPRLLKNRVLVSARRWQKHGIFRQTLRNWCLLTAFMLGVSPQRLADFYRRHDK